MEEAYSAPTMSALLVSNDLWEAIEPLLPMESPKPKGGRPRVSDRAALGGSSSLVLRTGCPWRRAAQKDLGCGDGPTCSRGCSTSPVPCSVSGSSPRVDPPPREEHRVASSGLPGDEHHRRVRAVAGASL